MANLIGQSLGQYKILSLLGTGGMAAVYRARQESIERDVALKVIRPQLSELESFIVRFRREAKLVASLSHPHIVKVFDYGQFEDMAFLVMELLTGGSLAQMIRQGPLPLVTTGKMLDQIASALDFAHQAGIIHRDLKPQNVLLDANQNAFLTDFGIAKIVEDNAHLTQSGTVMGTPAYMSPEQWSGQEIDGRADIYALGVMLFEMLTGRLPFDGNTPFLLMHQHIYETPRPVSEVNDNVPPAIADVVNQALAKDRADRFNTSGELAAAFKSAVSGLPAPDTRIKSPTKSVGMPQKAPSTAQVPARNDKTVVVAPETIPPTTPPRPSRPLIFGLVGAVGVVVVLGVVVVALLAKGQTPVATPIPTSLAVIASTEAPKAVTGTNPPVIALVSSPSLLPSFAPSAAVKATDIPTAMLTATAVPTATPTLIPTLVPTLTLTSTIDEEGTLNAAVQLTSTSISHAAQLAATIAARLTQTELAKPTGTFTPSNTPTETWTPTETPTQTFTPSETWTPEPTNTDEPTSTPGPTNTDEPTSTPAPTDTPAPVSVGLGTIALEFGSEGTGSGRFQDLRYIAVDGSGNIYTGEYSSGRIQKFDADGKFITSWIPDGKSPLRGLAVGRSGNVFVVRAGKILKYDGIGKLIKTIGDSSSFYDDVAMLPDGNLLVAVTNASNNDIVKLNANTGAEIAHFTNAISSQTDSAELDVRLTADGLGTIYALGIFSNAVFVFNANGKFQNRFGSFLAATDISVDGQSRVYVTDFGTIHIFDKNGAAIGDIGAPNNQAFQTVIDDSGNLYMASRDRVYKVVLALP